MERLFYFDQMKGVAIILVVIGHIFLFSFGDVNNSVVTFLSIFHMPVFFYISGYFAYKPRLTKREWFERVWKKTHYLLCPYISFAGIYCVFRGKDFIRLLLVGGAEYWFLYVLFLLTIFFLVYELLTKHIKHPVLYVVAWLIPYGVLIFLQRLLGEDIGGGLFAINQLVAYYRFYLLGYLCKKYVIFNDFIFKNTYVYVICFVAFLIRWYYGGSCNILVSFLGIIGAIIILQTFFFTSTYQDCYMMRTLSYIGKNSLEVYLIHYFFLPNLKDFIKPYIDIPNGFIWQFSLSFALAVPIIFACVFVGKVIKNNSLLSWILLGKKYS